MNCNLGLDGCALANDWLTMANAHVNNQQTTNKKTDVHQKSIDAVKLIKEMPAKVVQDIYSDFIKTLSNGSEEMHANLISCLAQNTFSDVNKREGSYHVFKKLIDSLKSKALENGSHILHNIVTSAWRQIELLTEKSPFGEKGTLPSDLLNPLISARKAILLNHHFAEKGWAALRENLNLFEIRSQGTPGYEGHWNSASNHRWIGLSKDARVDNLKRMICKELGLSTDNSRKLLVKKGHIKWNHTRGMYHNLKLSSYFKDSEKLQVTFLGSELTASDENWHLEEKNTSIRRESQTYAILRDSPLDNCLDWACS